ncbi:hypothetical protein ACHWUR_28560 [Klebsiella pneumoniae]
MLNQSPLLAGRHRIITRGQDLPQPDHTEVSPQQPSKTLKAVDGDASLYEGEPVW